MEGPGPPDAAAGLALPARNCAYQGHSLVQSSDEAQALSVSTGVLAPISEGQATFRDNQALSVSTGILAPISEGQVTFRDNQALSVSTGVLAPISEGQATFRDNQVRLPPIGGPSEGATGLKASQDAGSAPVLLESEGKADCAGFELQAAVPGRPHTATLSLEDCTALAQLVAESVAAKLAASLHAALKPLVDEQEDRLLDAIQSASPPLREPSFGTSANMKPMGTAVPERSHVKPSSVPSSQRSRKKEERLSSANFTTEPIMTPVTPLQIPENTSARAQTADQLSMPGPIRQPSSRGKPYPEPMLSYDQLDLTGQETDSIRKYPSLEGTMTHRWNRLRNFVSSSVGAAGVAGSSGQKPVGLQSLEEARGDELLATMVQDKPHRHDPPSEASDTTRAVTGPRLPTLTKMFNPFPGRVSTCPDVIERIESAAAGARDAQASAASASGSKGSGAQNNQWGSNPSAPGRSTTPSAAFQKTRSCDNNSKYRSEGTESDQGYDIRPEEWNESFIVRIDRRGVKRKLGIDVKREGNQVIITGIHLDGLVAAVNVGLSNKVAVDDRILEVNGTRDAILEALSSCQVLNLRLLHGRHRTPPTSCCSEDRGQSSVEDPTEDMAQEQIKGPGTVQTEAEPQGKATTGHVGLLAGFPRTAADALIEGEATSPRPDGVRSSRSIEEAARQAVASLNRDVGLERKSSSFSDGGALLSQELNGKISDSKRSAPKKPPEVPARGEKRRLTGGFNKNEAAALRMEREDELLNYLTEVSDATQECAGVASMASVQSQANTSANMILESKVRSPWLLCFCGILPFDSWLGILFRPFIVLLALGCVLTSAEQLMHAYRYHGEDSVCQQGVCMQFQRLSDVIMAVGSLLGMLVLRTLASANLLGSRNALLVVYARRQDVVEKWVMAARWQSIQLFVLWACSMALRIQMLYPMDDPRTVREIATFAIVSIIFMGITYSILHVSCAIAIMIDTYCVLLHNNQDLVKGVREWNMLQALLRKASRACERGFMILQTAVLATLLLSASGLILQEEPDFWKGGRWVLSNVMLAISVGLNFFKAAEVTEKCTRVPSLVNSLTFSTDMDLERHYLVEYVTYSMAGFYVGEVRLTAAMALKITYISGLAAFGMLTKLTAAV